MEFEEEEEHEEEEEDMEIPTPPAPAYELPVTNSASGKPKVLVGSNNNYPTTSSATTMITRYRECLKNHALGMGGHAVDGCGEFLAAGEEGTLDALKCAACNCHRNFHRKEVNDHHHHHHHHRSSPEVYHHYQQQFTPYYHHHHRSPQPPHHSGYLHMTTTSSQHHQRPPLALPAASGGGGQDLEDMSNPSSSGGGGGGGGGGGRTSSGGGLKKRFRTKFSQEQKEKMLQFAESLGWRIQKHDEAAVDQFCADTGVRRQVLKVWMHNNKNTLGKKP